MPLSSPTSVNTPRPGATSSGTTALPAYISYPPYLSPPLAPRTPSPAFAFPPNTRGTNEGLVGMNPGGRWSAMTITGLCVCVCVWVWSTAPSRPASRESGCRGLRPPLWSSAGIAACLKVYSGVKRTGSRESDEVPLDGVCDCSRKKTIKIWIWMRGKWVSTYRRLDGDHHCRPACSRPPHKRPLPRAWLWRRRRRRR